MKVRIITGICMGAVMIPVLLFSQYIIYPIFLSLLCLMATYEMLKVFKKERRPEIAVPSFLLAASYPMIPFFIRNIDWQLGFVIMALGICLYMIYLFAMCVAHKGRMLLVEVFSTFTTVTYILIGFSALSIIRYLPFGEYEFLLIFFTAWGCDIFAYFVGTFIGKHKLIVEVSPKKTVEGAIGGVVCTFAIIMLYGFLIERFTDANANYIALAILGLVLPVISQIGDLFASLIKREAGIKDYSNLFPGHGGVMDRFDSMIAVAITTLMITMILPPFH
ncbi:MAG: phosphatidate cytidylyltransferase [Clostridia bacterium]|nr:phosphatidate cytidylyltransferase [Clostridia bacterium]MBR2324566.1 phosphatidate cytidylyltransferase [Clostridia bacterium]